jgi:hypothetical protein
MLRDRDDGLRHDEGSQEDAAPLMRTALSAVLGLIALLFLAFTVFSWVWVANRPSCAEIRQHDQGSDACEDAGLAYGVALNAGGASLVAGVIFGIGAAGVYRRSALLLNLFWLGVVVVFEGLALFVVSNGGR